MLANMCNCPSGAVWEHRLPPANHWRVTRYGDSVCVSQTGVAVVTGTIYQWTGSMKNLKTHKCLWHTCTRVIQQTGREYARVSLLHVCLVLGFSVFIQAYGHFQTQERARRRTWLDFYQKAIMRRVGTPDDLIALANLLAFLWTLAHKVFMNSFLGLKSSNCDPMKGSESYKRIVKAAFFFYASVQSFIHFIISCNTAWYIYFFFLVFFRNYDHLQALWEGTRFEMVEPEIMLKSLLTKC